MPSNVRAMQLLAALEGQPPFKARGFRVDYGPTGGVVVERANHVRGIWHLHAGVFYWTPAGYTQPNFQTASLDDALDYTLEHVLAA